MGGGEKRSSGRVRTKKPGQSRRENRFIKENIDSELESDPARRFLMLLIIADINASANSVSICRMVFVLGWRQSVGSR